MTDEAKKARRRSPDELFNRYREKIKALEQALAASRETELAYLELLHGLHEHIAESVGLIDAGKKSAARKALDAAVVMLDKVDFSRLAEPDQATTPNERPLLQFTKAESDGLADFMVSHSGTIAGAKAVLVKDGPDEARSKLTDAVQVLVRHLATIGVTKRGE